MKKYLFLLSILMVSLVSCKKDEIARPASGYFLKANIGGQDYQVTDQQMFNTFQYTDEDGCISTKRYTYANISQIETTNFFFDLYIKHYEKEVDFMGSQTGRKDVHSDLDDVGTICNLDLTVLYQNKADLQWYLPTNQRPINVNVTKITKTAETSTYVKYDIEGDFDFQLLLGNTTNYIPVTGTYRTWIEVLK